MQHYYRLNENGIPVPADLYEWADIVVSKPRVVARTEVGEGRAVSTVFWGVDRNLSDIPHEPCVWESMLFTYGEGQEQHNYAGTLEQAQAHHRDLVELYAQRFNVPAPQIEFADLSNRGGISP